MEALEAVEAVVALLVEGLSAEEVLEQGLQSNSSNHLWSQLPFGTPCSQS